MQISFDFYGMAGTSVYQKSDNICRILVDGGHLTDDLQGLSAETVNTLEVTSTLSNEERDFLLQSDEAVDNQRVVLILNFERAVTDKQLSADDRTVLLENATHAARALRLVA